VSPLSLLLVFAVSAPALAERPPPNPDPRPMGPPDPHLDALAGASDLGDWAVSLEAGFPFFGARGQVALPWAGLNAVGSVNSALFTDTWALGGVSRRWVDTHRVVLSGEILVGGTIRSGDLSRRGPASQTTLRLARGHGRVVPALTLSSRHVLLTDVQEIQTTEGDLVQRSRSIAWSPVASFDVGVGVCPGFAVSAGLDVPWFDPPGFSLPGAHINLIVGGWK